MSEVTRSRASLASVSDVPDLDKPQSRDGDDEGAEVEASRERAGMDSVCGGGGAHLKMPPPPHLQGPPDGCHLQLWRTSQSARLLLLLHHPPVSHYRPGLSFPNHISITPGETHQHITKLGRDFANESSR